MDEKQIDIACYNTDRKILSTKNMNSLATKFQQIYANLPLNQRQDVVVVIDNEPLSWNATKLEVDNDTDKGDQALELLAKLGIIK